MFLRELRLQNIRGIKDLRMDFSDIEDAKKIRKWTLLLGENGTGKSTILRSAGLLLAGSEDLTDLVGEADQWIRAGASSGSICGTLETQDGGSREVSLHLNRGMKRWDLVKANQQSLERLDHALSHTPRNYFVAGYGASRRMPGGSHPQSSRGKGVEFFMNARGQSMGSLFFADAALQSLQDWAVDLHYRRGEEGLDVIRRGLKGLLPGATLDRIEKKDKQLLFKTVDGVVPLSQLSDGYQNVAAWCSDLLYRITTTFDDYKNPLHTRGLLLMDEIDLHLHPVWQRKLVEFLSDKLPNFQILASTHSPLTAQQAGAGVLHLLERKSPRSAPVLSQFEGVPREMWIEDLVISKWFGLETGYSSAVEKTMISHKVANKVNRNSAVKKSATAAKRPSRKIPDIELARVTAPRRRMKIEKENAKLLAKLDKIVSTLKS